jgi:hypothetical protein
VKEDPSWILVQSVFRSSWFTRKYRNMKLSAHRAGLPGKVISFYIVPLDPAYPAGSGTGHVPVKQIISVKINP